LGEDEFYTQHITYAYLIEIFNNMDSLLKKLIRREVRRIISEQDIDDVFGNHLWADKNEFPKERTKQFNEPNTDLEKKFFTVLEDYIEGILHLESRGLTPWGNLLKMFYAHLKY